jgi:exonuclease SbcC
VIPLRLKLSGFLSYRDPVELDFSGFTLACISGQNGAGKSSLLDAMTWALFGQARKRDESVVNLQSKTAEVTFTFEYENNQYRVIRSLARGKTTILEFQIFYGSDWRPLTEHTNRGTQERIEKVLRLDYDTFINVSFFLQGRADQFAQQAPPRRKEILGSILGLEIWDVYKERAGVKRKEAESALGSVDGRMDEIEAELAEEEPRKKRLVELETDLNLLEASRKVQEAILASIKQVRAGLEKQRDRVQKMEQALNQLQKNLNGFQERFAGREVERGPHAELMGRAGEVEAAYLAWQQARKEIEKWGESASQFHEQEKLRLPFLTDINAEKAKLEQEKETLIREEEKVSQQLDRASELAGGLERAKIELAETEIKREELNRVEKDIQAGRERQAELRTENTNLKDEMEDLDLRIKKLSAAEGATCPLCGQVLSAEHRQSTLEQLQVEGTQEGDTWRANKSEMENLGNHLLELEVQFANYGSTDANRLRLSSSVAQLSERLETLKKETKEWEKTGAKRLARVNKLLAGEKYAVEVRKKLAVVDKELAALGYEVATHEEARRTEIQLRPAEITYRELESAKSALKPLNDEIANLNIQIKTLMVEISEKQAEHNSEAAALAVLEAQAPDLESAETSLFDAQERENKLYMEVGAARQKVAVLDDQRKRKKKYEVERGELGLQIGRYKALERAFGKDGVPALLIEQALPEIEMKANEILGRLSDDSMRLHFETQAKYKDEKRKDLRETLEIQVSDGAGERDYELFSGGEAFRVNFAIRLALSEVLAQRKGARLQMLVIDEGFGSQDAQGRQRLIQSINAVRNDFEKILVITHLDELKDAFPTRIEVEKTETGSTVTVI